MITVMEYWYFKPGLEDKMLELLQKMDDLVGPPAHVDPAWSDHAHFYQSKSSPNMAIMCYHWRSIEEHKESIVREEPLLKEFVELYCTRNREIHYFDELPVDVEHDASGEQK